MRSLLVLSFLLYDFVAYAFRQNGYDYDDPEGGARQRDMDPPESIYRGQRRYEDGDTAKLVPKMRSAEIGHSTHDLDKENEKKVPFTMTCERLHERYEPCFAGCAAVTCDNPRERLRPCYPFCEPGCICIHPYMRDDRTHKCVLPEDCTKGLKGIPDLGDDI
ncbi:uncharacterized protein LOC126771556 isoform X2 [Nymphalis io]|uniref:uncharacterized protein LOC126771556 isoform X2 n=1 Tax=Inachis io TaxID=171585 RepID=UPI0021694401|nr:uncharacterized protein LOC126771556 isoform X2 [Nymphalis io]